MKSFIRVAVGALVVGVVAAQVSAFPISSPFNSRPVLLGSSGEPTLQSILDGLWGAGVVNAATDQQSAGMWGFSSSIGSSIPSMVVEYAGDAPVNAFGIWFGTDSLSLFEYDMLLGPATGGALFDTASLVISGNTLFINAAGPSACGVEVNCTAPGVGVTDSRINAFAFGFYLRNATGTFYTLDELNSDVALSLAFRKPGTDTWAMAFEDRIAGDFDYNDMVVKVESLDAVPEPGTLLLLGGGLVGVASRRRRKLS